MNCFEKLNLPQTATLAEVKLQWRKIAAQHHPDKGGDAVDFADYQRAYRTALALIEQKDCARCLGTKQVPADGFTFTYVPCPLCSGR